MYRKKISSYEMSNITRLTRRMKRIKKGRIGKIQENGSRRVGEGRE
jgi:hypothetical protein